MEVQSDEIAGKACAAAIRILQFFTRCAGEGCSFACRLYGDFFYEAGYDLTRTSFDSFLLEIILDGRMHFETEGEALSAGAGQAVIIDCTKHHRYHTDTGCRALWVHFDGASARGYFELIRRQNGRVFTTHRFHRIHEALQNIYDMFRCRQPLNEIQMALYLTEALTAMAEPARPAIASDRVWLTDQAVAAISRNVGREPSVKALAAMVGLSEYHFIRVFRDAMGVTPWQYIIANRMNHAKYLLKSTALPIGEIGSKVGYSSESMFSAAFRRTQGITPSQYRSGGQP